MKAASSLHSNACNVSSRGQIVAACLPSLDCAVHGSTEYFWIAIFNAIG